MSAGDFDYDTDGLPYALHRRADPRIESVVHAALGSARTVLNVGAGSGSYEPVDRSVLAVEPSPAMRAQRPPDGIPAIDGVAERLPFDADSFDAAMAIMTVHQWREPARGLRELRRVARGPVVVLTFDGDELSRFWLAEYVPALFSVERRRFPPIPLIAETLGGHVTVDTVPVHADCTDGFGEAFFARPEKFLDPAVRRAQSGWGFVPDDDVERGLAALAADLASGSWDNRHRALRARPTYEGSLRLVVSIPY